eukprot:TRINITY_DN51650_c0_g1_i1.p2 TRINITY_DN51650_c0_g1~~TRINITY_DN51650_c0_g1_i1.p2  ORF type:complete len:266 (-),score=18.44 TRINITY_DN51650_c0_g1_i1:134-931(-)
MMRTAARGVALAGAGVGSPAVTWPHSLRRCDAGLLRRWRCFKSSRPSRGAESSKATGDGISQEVQYNNVWEQITTFPKRRPFVTNVILATVKTSAADLVIQTAEGRSEYDWRRNGLFTAFGFFMLGGVQWVVYVNIFTKVCPNAIRFANAPWKEKLKDRAGQIDLAKQVFLDNFVYQPFLYFPVFYTFKEAIQGGDGITLTMDTVKSAMSKYYNNFVVDVLAMAAVYVPGDVLVYSVPIWMRLPLNHAVSFGWTMILSVMRGSNS